MDTTTLRRRAVAAVLTTACLVGPTLAIAPVSAATTPVSASAASTDAGTLANVAPPAISGTPAIGSVLTGDPGQWSSADLTFAYQWQSAGVDIPGATEPTFTLTWGQSAQPVTVVVTATAADSSTATATSAVLFVPPGTPANLTRPSITGTAEVGETVTADPGTWDAPELGYDFQWRSGGVDIVGAVTATHTIAPAEGGKPLTVVVTAHRDSVNAATAVSSAVDVPAVAPTSLTPPVIRDAWGYVVGAPLTADPGTWDVDGAVFAYQWKDNGADIPGATTDSFTAPFALLNHQLTVTVTATKDGLTSAPVASEPVTIEPGSVGVLTPPALSGDPRPGSTLTVDPGTADVDTATVEYQWYADYAPIAGATSSTYVVRPQDVGRQIDAGVTWSAPDYLWGMAFTDTVTILPASLTHAAAPRILGTPLVGRTLSVKPGTWSATDGVALRYQWTIDGKPVTGATRSTFTVPAAAAGKRVGVVETASGAAYITASQSSAAVVAKATPTLELKITRPGKGKVKVTVTVAAAVTATGKVVVKVGHVTRTLVLHGGKATTTVKKLRKGKVKVTASYAGSAAVTAGKKAASTRVK